MHFNFMCGIAGFIDFSQTLRAERLGRIIETMTAHLSHRGPDSDGHWVDQDLGVALGHRRLSILDLSDNGSQPMRSCCERYSIVYNGEIYNHLELRKELELNYNISAWRGTSDTETILSTITHMGIERTLKKLNGMFAFAVWDHKLRRLSLARDRIGEKPLYYGWHNRHFLFASELTPLVKAISPDKFEIDRTALALYMRHTHVPAPYSIYKNIGKLLPGHYLELDQAGSRAAPLEPKAYWRLEDVVRSGIQEPFKGSLRDAADILEKLMLDSVNKRMLSDVPLGAFLSGGIDSSLITALMGKQSSKDVKTFTIGFDENDYDEAIYAKQVARHLGTEHHELYVSPKQTLEVIPRLSKYYDEPFADSSQIPTALVSEMARKHVSVCLSGDAGDELFGGYYRYIMADALWKRAGWMPYMFRSLISTSLNVLNSDQWDGIASTLMYALPRKKRIGMFGDKIAKLAAALKFTQRDDIYKNLLQHWQDAPNIVLGAGEPDNVWGTDKKLPDSMHFSECMMYYDTLTYLQNDILTKVDLQI